MSSDGKHYEKKIYLYPFQKQMSQAKFHFAHEDLILVTALLYPHLMDEKSEVMKRLKELTQEHAFEKQKWQRFTPRKYSSEL